jgi:diguanylate cyclase (GGDEF)-like protein
MNEIAPDTLTVLPNPSLFRAARWMQRTFIVASGGAILFGLLPLLRMGVSSSATAAARGQIPLFFTAFWCGVSLLASDPEREGTTYSYLHRVANLLTLAGGVAIVFWTRFAATGTSVGNPPFPPARLAFGFVFLAVAVVLVDKRSWFVNGVVDVLVCGLCLLALLLISDALFGRFALFGRVAGGAMSTAVLACFAALTGAVALRQGERGVFSIFLGVGIGSTLARIFAPVLLALPFVWEILSSRMSRGGSIDHMSAAMLASAGVTVALSILLYFVWRISTMENEIHDLILRDQATRLYNFRGFHMLAEHALRLAQRSNTPFSILFIELETLAQIHAQLGEGASAASLAEAGEILQATFRESDIKGRIGAVDFAVAGQFDRAGITVAALRLEGATAARGAKNGRPIPLRFSMGHVTTTGADAQATLKELLVRARQMRHQHDQERREMRVN